MKKGSTKNNYKHLISLSKKSSSSKNKTSLPSPRKKSDKSLKNISKSPKKDNDIILIERKVLRKSKNNTNIVSNYSSFVNQTNKKNITNLNTSIKSQLLLNSIDISTLNKDISSSIDQKVKSCLDKNNNSRIHKNKNISQTTFNSRQGSLEKKNLNYNDNKGKNNSKLNQKSYNQYVFDKISKENVKKFIFFSGISSANKYSYKENKKLSSSTCASPPSFRNSNSKGKNKGNNLNSLNSSKHYKKSNIINYNNLNLNLTNKNCQKIIFNKLNQAKNSKKNSFLSNNKTHISNMKNSFGNELINKKCNTKSNNINIIENIPGVNSIYHQYNLNVPKSSCKGGANINSTYSTLGCKVKNNSSVNKKNNNSMNMGKHSHINSINLILNNSKQGIINANNLKENIRNRINNGIINRTKSHTSHSSSKNSKQKLNINNNKNISQCSQSKQEIIKINDNSIKHFSSNNSSTLKITNEKKSSLSQKPDILHKINKNYIISNSIEKNINENLKSLLKNLGPQYGIKKSKKDSEKSSQQSSKKSTQISNINVNYKQKNNHNHNHILNKEANKYSLINQNKQNIKQKNSLYINSIGIHNVHPKINLNKILIKDKDLILNNQNIPPSSRNQTSQNFQLPSFSSSSSYNNDSNYYMSQSNKLSFFIKNYYSKFKSYPKTTQNFYKYGRLIGSGAFGKVNIGLNVLIGRIVAIKSFNNKNMNKDEDNKKKIIYETNLMKHLNHPSIVKILETFESEKYFFIVMEYINGGNLYNFVKKRRKLTEKTAKFLFWQIIQGIKYMHSKNIVHRDIKLENILIDLNNRVKICDFGIGKILQNKNQLLYEQCGTPVYIAPEILLSSKNNGYEAFPVDMWSAGIALYIMLSGTLPFQLEKISNNKSELLSENEKKRLYNEELQNAIINKEFKKIENISDEAKDLIKGLLNKDPRQRYNCDDVLNHEWFINDSCFINNKEKYNLFTKAENIMLSKTYVDYRYAKKSDLKENFSLSNLNSDLNLNSSCEGKMKNNLGGYNNVSKSFILAPYNSMLSEESFDEYINENIEMGNLNIENSAIRFNHKTKEFNMNYELNNNGELDNGILINSKFDMENNLSYDDDNKAFEQGNNGVSSGEGIKKKDKNEILNKIEQLGYDKNYVCNCLENNELCQATAIYYLIENYDHIE